MKKEDFLSLMDGIDDRLVEKYAISEGAEARQKQIQRQRRQRWFNRVTGCAVAAIILGVIGVAMLCASFGIVRMDRQSQNTPVSLGDSNDHQNNEKNENNGNNRNRGDEEKNENDEKNELLLHAYLSYIGVEEQDIQEIQKMNQHPKMILLTRGDSEQQWVSIDTAVYFVYTTDLDKVLTVLTFDLPDKAVRYGCSEIEIVDNWEQYAISQANAVLYSEETQEFQSLRCDTTNEYQLTISEISKISGISSAKGKTQSLSRIVVSFTVDRTRRSLNVNVYRILFHLKSTFLWILAAWTLAAAAMVVAALWFLNRSVKLKRLKEGTRAGRFLFGKEIEYGAVVEKIENIDLFNPSQYLTKNGVVNPGSSGRYHLEFRLQDDTHVELSVSAKQAGKFEPGMRGTLVHRRNILISFVPEDAEEAK